MLRALSAAPASYDARHYNLVWQPPGDQVRSRPPPAAAAPGRTLQHAPDRSLAAAARRPSAARASPTRSAPPRRARWRRCSSCAR